MVDMPIIPKFTVFVRHAEDCKDKNNGGPGIVTPGCPVCRKRLFTMANFMDHRADEVHRQ